MCQVYHFCQVGNKYWAPEVYSILTFPEKCQEEDMVRLSRLAYLRVIPPESKYNVINLSLPPLFQASNPDVPIKEIKECWAVAFLIDPESPTGKFIMDKGSEHSDARSFLAMIEVDGSHYILPSD